MLRFLLDEDVSYRVAQELRHRGVDAVSIHEVHRTGLRDEDQLTYASAEGRVLVTYNRADFQALDGQWRVQERAHAGILWCAERTLPRRSIGDLVRALEAASSRFESLDGLCIPLSRA